MIWNYPPLEEATQEAGIEDMEVYTRRPHNTMTKHIPTRPIMDLCLEAERQPRVRVTKQWWDRKGMSFVG